MPPLDLDRKEIKFKLMKTAEHMIVFVAGFFIILGLILGGSYFMTNHDTPCPETTELKPVEGAVDPNLIDSKPTQRRRLNKNGLSQRYIYLVSEGREDRMKELLSHYPQVPDYPVRQTVARIHRIYPEMLICVAYADSSLGNFLKTPNNFGNVGNNDRGDKVTYITPEAGVNAIGQVLNNRYLGQYKTVDQLSRYGNKEGMIYASSEENRHNNVTNCIGMIRDKGIPDNFAFRW